MEETNLARIRKERNMTQKQLAEASGVSIRKIQDYEQGHRFINNVAAITAYKLATALMVPVGAILELQ